MDVTNAYNEAVMVYVFQFFCGVRFKRVYKRRKKRYTQLWQIRLATAMSCEKFGLQETLTHSWIVNYNPENLMADIHMNQGVFLSLLFFFTRKESDIEFLNLLKT